VIQRLVLIALAFPMALRGEGAPTTAFQVWARVHMHAIAPTDENVASARDLAMFRAVTRGARVVAFRRAVSRWLRASRSATG